MPDHTPIHSLQFPIPGDHIKTDSSPAKLAADIQSLANSTEVALSRTEERAAKAGSPFRGVLPNNTIVSKFYTEGTHQVIGSDAAASMTGLPVKEAGTLEVIKTNDSIWIHRYTTTGGTQATYLNTTASAAIPDSWMGWESMKNPTRTTAKTLTLPAGDTQTDTETNVHVRIPFRVPVRCRLDRVRFANFNDRFEKAYGATLNLAATYLGEYALDALSFSNADFKAGTVTKIMDAASRNNNWITPKLDYWLEPGRIYLLSYGYTAPAGTINHRAEGGCWRNNNSVTTGDVTGAFTQSKTAPLDVTLQLTASEGTPLNLYMGDSTMAGTNTDWPVFDSFANRHAEATGALGLNMSHAGAGMGTWTFYPNYSKWTKYAAFSRFDRCYLTLGANEVNDGLEVMQQRLGDLMPLIRKNFTPVVIATTVKSRNGYTPQEDADRHAYNTWLEGLPHDLYALLELAAPLANADGNGLRPEFDSGDGTHPNSAGQRRIGQVLITGETRPVH